MAWRIFNRTPSPLPFGPHGVVPGDSTDSVTVDETGYDKIKHLLAEGIFEAEKIGEEIVEEVESLIGHNKKDIESVGGAVANEGSVIASHNTGLIGQTGTLIENTGTKIGDIANPSGGNTTNNPPSTPASSLTGAGATPNGGDSSVGGSQS